ncbi:unnamed protein product [Urochloa humidicola]
MHRSSSYYLQQSSSSTAASPSPAAGGGAAAMDVDHLPTYDPQSDAAKKEALNDLACSLLATLNNRSVKLIRRIILANSLFRKCSPNV